MEYDIVLVVYVYTLELQYNSTRKKLTATSVGGEEPLKLCISWVTTCFLFEFSQLLQPVLVPPHVPIYLNVANTVMLVPEFRLNHTDMQ